MYIYKLKYHFKCYKCIMYINFIFLMYLIEYSVKLNFYLQLFGVKNLYSSDIFV